MTDSLASLREMLNGPSIAGLTHPAPAHVGQIQVDPIKVSQSLTPTKTATPVALPIKKKLDTFTMVLISGGILLCAYVYYKYFRNPKSQLSARTKPIPSPGSRTAAQRAQQNAQARQARPSVAKHVQFSEDANNSGPTLEEIHDDSDLVQQASAHAGKETPASPPQAVVKKPAEPPLGQSADKPGPKNGDSKDPNFQVVPPATAEDDPDL